MGKSKSIVTGFRYYLGMHFGVCYGPVDAVKEIRVGDKLAWSGEQTASGTISIDQPSLFGGDKKEGGISGSLAVCMGEAAQTPNSYLQSQLGNDIPAYRGVLGMVWNGMVAAVNPYIKPWAFRVQRITEGWHNDSTWYEAKAVIGSQLVAYDAYWDWQQVALYVPPDPAAFTVPASGYTSQQAPFGHTGDYAVSPLQNTEWAKDTAMWMKRTIVTDGRDITLRFNVIENGALVYWDGVYVGGFNTTNVQLAYGLSDQTLTIPGTLATPGSHELAIYAMDESANYGSNDNTYIGCVVEGDNDMNPAHIIYQCLTDPDWGMGYPTSAIDDANFTEVADTLYSEGFGLSFLWNQPDQIKSFIRMVLDHIGGVLRVDRQTGLYQIKLVRDDYDIETIDQVDVSNSTLTSWQRAAWAETVNEVTVVYKSGTKDRVVTVQDMVNADIQGAIINKKQNYPGITSASLAMRVAERDLRSMSTPLAKARLQVNREAWNWLPGDVVRLVHTPMGIDAAYRVLELNLGTHQDNMIEVDMAEDIFGLADASWNDQQELGWSDTSSVPAESPDVVITELPYYTLARSLSAADLDYLEETDCRIQVIAAQPSGDSGSYRLWTVAGAGDLVDRGDVGEWTQYATLSGNLTKENSSTITADSLDSFMLDGVETGQYLLIDDEIMRLDAWDTDLGTIDVQRGCLDTVPAAHTDGAKIWFADANSTTDEQDYIPSEVVHVKCQTQAGDADYLDIDDTPEETYTIDQRHARPYPPGKFQINTSYWPANYTGRTIAVTWAHRDRTQQTAEITPQTDASIGPEAGVTYNCRLYNGADQLMEEETGISGASHTFNVSEARYFRMKSLDVAGGANFKISEARLYNNGSVVDSGATITSSSAPTSGSLANLQDTNLSTYAQWTAATAEGAGFWIKWDAGVGNTMHVSEMRLGGGTSSTEYLNGFTLQMSHDNATWIDVKAVTGLSYPGNNTLSSDIDVRPDDLKVELESVRAGLLSWQTHVWEGSL